MYVIKRAELLPHALFQYSVIARASLFAEHKNIKTTKSGTVQALQFNLMRANIFGNFPTDFVFPLLQFDRHQYMVLRLCTVAGFVLLAKFEISFANC